MELLARACQILYDKHIIDVSEELKYTKEELAKYKPNVSGLDVDKAVEKTWIDFKLQFEDGECTLSWYGELHVFHPVFDTRDLTGFVNGCAFLMRLDIVEDFLDFIEDEFRTRCRYVYSRQKRETT